MIAIDRRVGSGSGEWRVAELTDQGDACAAMEGATHLIHLASHTAPDMSDPARVLLDNVRIAANVLGAFERGSPVTAVAASSISVYGLVWGDEVRSPDYAPLDEEHPCWGMDTYSQSKMMVEQMCANSVRRSSMSAVALRFPWVADGIPSRMAAYLDPMRADPGGELGRRHLWSYIHVDDVADAAVRALDVDDGTYHVVNLAAREAAVEQRLRELMSAFHPGTDLRPSLEEFGPWNTGRARSLLGWAPRRDLGSQEESRQVPARSSDCPA